MVHAASTLQQMLDEGILTKERVFGEPLWITSDIIRRMNNAIIRDAMENGTVSWDHDLQQALQLCMQSALAARAGDITRSKKYVGNECLLYKDVQVKLVTKDGEEKLWAVITMRSVKGFKYVCPFPECLIALTWMIHYRLDPQNNKTVEIGEVTNPELNVCCPIKLLLVWALRVGAVRQSNWEDLLAGLRGSASHSIVWTRPDFPVFCGKYIGKGKQFRYDLPVGTQNATKAVARGGQLLGLLARPIPHDIRRGAAREFAHLNDIPGSNLEATRIALGHSRKTAAMGVTERYVGDTGVDTWDLRLSSTPDSMPGEKHRLDFAETSYRKPKQRRNPLDVDELCARFGLDPGKKTDRATAVRRADKLDFEAWVSVQKAARDEVPPLHPTAPEYMMHTDHSKDGGSMVSLAASATGHSPTPPEYIMHRGHSDGGSEVSLTTIHSPSPTQLPVTDCNGVAPTERELTDDKFDTLSDDDIPIDPALQDLTRMLLGTPGEAQEDMLWQASLSPVNDIQLSDNCAAIVGDRSTFITFFSKINFTTIVNDKDFARHDFTSSFAGNTSRDEATKFRWPCPNARFGCDKDFVNLQNAHGHHASCTITSPGAYQAHLQELQGRQYPCTKCPKFFNDAESLRKHLSGVHWTPSRCMKSGCTSEEIFQSRIALRKHHEQVHRGWDPRGCPEADCPSATHIFSRPDKLKRHLTTIHNFSNEQLAPHLPPPRHATFKPQRCSHPDCEVTTLYGSRKGYQEHAMTIHGKSPRCLEEIPGKSPRCLEEIPGKSQDVSGKSQDVSEKSQGNPDESSQGNL
ncbi:hypothetical protein AUP68_02907 [Ilyonectria robusta]